MSKIVENKILDCPVNISLHKSTKIITNDDKYNMYINALPSQIRLKVFENKLNPRDIYVKYRKIGKDKIINEINENYK